DGKGRQDNLIPRTQPQSLNRDIQRRRTISHRDAMLPPYPLGKALLKLPYEGSLGGDPTGFDTFQQVFFLIAVEKRLVDRDKRAHHTPLTTAWQLAMPGKRVLSP